MIMSRLVSVTTDSDSSDGASRSSDGEGQLGDSEVFTPTAGMLALEPRRRRPPAARPKASTGCQTTKSSLRPVPEASPKTSPAPRGLEYDVSAQLGPATPACDKLSPGGEMELLERLVKTHPIWYLPHLSRAAAAHLLKRKEPGAFIVRESSRASTMALSIRLGLEDPLELDHYLIETTAAHSVRLQGSPHTFPVLPLLLAHYADHGEELRARLRLPSALLGCGSRRELQSYALLGQDFWSSEEAMSESVASLRLSAAGPSPLPDDDDCTCLERSPSASPPREPGPSPEGSPQAKAAKKPTTQKLKQWLFPPRIPNGITDMVMEESLHSLHSLSQDACASRGSPESSAGTGQQSGRGNGWRGSSLRSAPVPPPKPGHLRREKSDLGPELLRARKSKGLILPASSATSGTLAAPQSQSFTACVAELRERGMGRRPAARLGGPALPDGVGSLRVKKPSDWIRSASAKEHRLSAPNLQEAAAARARGGEPAAAYSGRLGSSRGPGGELSTINEGLVTPVALRKNLAGHQARELDAASTAKQRLGLSRAEELAREERDRRFSQSLEDLLQAARADTRDRREPEKAAENRSFARKFASERLSPRKKMAAPKDAWRNRDGSFHARVAKVAPSVTRPRLEDIVPCPKAPVLAGVQDYSRLVGSAEESRRRTVPVPPPSVPGCASMTARRPPSQESLEDSLSVAGTVFNEPWDSSVWENLVDIGAAAPPAALEPSTEPAVPFEKRPSPEDEDAYGSLAPAAAEFRARRAAVRELQDNEWRLNNRPEESKPSPQGSSQDSGGGSERWSPSPSPIPAVSESRGLIPITTEVEASATPLLGTRVLGQAARARNAQDPATRIQNYIIKLADDSDTVFGATCAQFIECTLQGSEIDPAIVCRNTRQFMSGMKNYLSKHGEGGLHQLIEEERSRLRPDQLLNIDALLELALHRLLLRPLQPHLYRLLLHGASLDGGLEALSASVRRLQTLDPARLGLAPAAVPDEEDMDFIKSGLRRMQSLYSPLHKLDQLLAITRLASKAFPSPPGPHPLSPSASAELSSSLSGSLDTLSPRRRRELPPADDLLRWLVLVIGRSGFVGCGLEATYIWALLPQSLLSGEGAYFLSALHSALHVLRHLDGALPRLAARDGPGLVGPSPALPSDATTDGLVRIAFPDEGSGSIEYHTFPLLPAIPTAKLCRMIAHKQGITNPEDHGLYLLVDGYETCLLGSEEPETIRAELRRAGKPHMFAYKRHEAKIAWPKVPMSPRPL